MMPNKISGDALTNARAWPDEDIIRLVKRVFPRNAGIGRSAYEVGCGNGRNLWFLCVEGFKAGGCDPSRACVLEAQAKLALCGYPYVGPFIQAAAYPQLPLEDGALDLVLDCQVSQHLRWSEHEAAYHEVCRVLKPGGFFVLTHLLAGSSDNYIGVPNLEEWTKDSDLFRDASRAVYPGNGITCYPPAALLSELLVHIDLTIRSAEVTRRTHHGGAAHSVWCNILAETPQ